MKKNRFNQRKQRIKAEVTPTDGQTVPASSASGHVKVGHQTGGVAAGIYVEHQTIHNPAPTGHSTSVSVGRIHGNPPTLSAAFTGREEILQALHATLYNDNAALTPPRAALQGLGGIGKTQTALAYLYKHRNDYADLFWCVGETPEQLTSQLAAFAPTLDPPVSMQADQNATLQQVKQWFATHENWLLVVDNAENLSKLKAHLPPLNRGRLLLTTRDLAMSGLAKRIVVDRLDEENGALLLLRRAGLIEPNIPFADISPQLQEDAHAISREVDGLPLALDQAGAYIETRQIPPARYRELYQQCRETLHRGYDNPDHASVSLTFDMALKQVEQVPTYGIAAAQLVRLCAFLAPDAIPEEIFTQGTSVLDEPLCSLAGEVGGFEDVYAVACRYALLRHDAEHSAFTMHRLAQEVVRDSLNEDERKQMAQQVVPMVSLSFPTASFPTWNLCERLLPHSLRSAAHIHAYDVHTASATWLLDRMASYLRQCGRYGEAEPLLVEALAIQREMQSGKLSGVATALNNLALLYDNMGRLKEAIPLMEETLAITRSTIGTEHPRYATRLDNLAGLYCAQGRYDEAETMYQQALDITRRMLGAQHPEIAKYLNNLALVYSSTRRYADAEVLLLEALTIDRQTLGDADPTYATDLLNLGVLYLTWGRRAQAEPLLHQALLIHEVVLGPQHPSVARCHHWLGVLCHQQGDQLLAVDRWRQALTILERTLGANHPDTVTTRKNLAKLITGSRLGM